MEFNVPKTHELFRQMIREFVEKEVTKNGFDVRLREGERESTWVLIDMNEVVVHIFTEDARSTYRLEALWADQPQETM